MIKILLFLLMSLGLPSHDIQVAYFKVYQDNDVVRIDFIFEKEDILQALNQETSSFRTEKLQKYLQEKFTLTINDKKRSLDYNLTDVKDKHIHVKARLTEPIDLINSIEIDNKCLLTIEDHSNIIELRINDRERDFLMNVDRTKISVNYK